MNKELIKQIKKALSKMYPGFHFDVQATQDGLQVIVTAFKGTTSISKFITNTDVPIDEFWDAFKAWMKTIYTR